MILEFVCLATGLFLAMMAYLHLARKKRILDLPNHRSSHQEITIRGGGIVIPLAVLSYWVVYQQHPFFVLGVLIISLISFVDDLRPLSTKIRLLFHFLAVCSMVYALDFGQFHWIILPIVFILVIGWINAVNFMDGINGITVAYALVVIGTLLYIDLNQIEFIQSSLLSYLLIGLTVFAFFNFRKKAVCFAGDIGSVSIAFVLAFLLITLILQTGQIAYAGFVLLYAIDSVGTIVERLLQKQNIFEPHRLHFYQRLANDRNVPHLRISAGYAFIQLAINMLLIISASTPYATLVLLGLLVSLSLLYVFIKQRLFQVL